jgi:hypothetical protein
MGCRAATVELYARQDVTRSAGSIRRLEPSRRRRNEADFQSTEDDPVPEDVVVKIVSHRMSKISRRSTN